jgi:DNA topoisomerase VI subunit B
MATPTSSEPPEASTGFEQAKNPARGPQFLQIVAKPERVAARAEPEPKLTRVAFKVSRLMEFCTQRELQTQTGHSIGDWPLVVIKELVDNALDACEEAEIAPEIRVVVDRGKKKDTVVVEDNAGGIDAETIKSVLDYSIRVSSREAYVSPTRGAQGNALKTVLAMGYVLECEIGRGAEAAGVTIIESRGVKHRIEFRVDHISNQPKIIHATSPSPVTVGTRIAVEWPAKVTVQWNDLLLSSGDRFQELVETYAWFNPHLTLRGSWLGREFVDAKATNPAWEKWLPTNPTSPHWYGVAHLQRYLAAHVDNDRNLGQDHTVRAFVAEFRGLSATALQRKVLDEVGCSHRSLASFFGVKKINSAGIAKLLQAMQKHSKPVRPELLGVIGEAHFKARFLAAGGNAATFAYQPRTGVEDGIPYVAEVVFGVRESGLSGGDAQGRKFVTGVNWSPAIGNPFRSFGRTGEGLESGLTLARANASEPVISAVHLAMARVQYADRGKSSIILND